MQQSLSIIFAACHVHLHLLPTTAQHIPVSPNTSHLLLGLPIPPEEKPAKALPRLRRPSLHNLTLSLPSSSLSMSSPFLQMRKKIGFFLCLENTKILHTLKTPHPKAYILLLLAWNVLVLLLFMEASLLQCELHCPSSKKLSVQDHWALSSTLEPYLWPTEQAL